MTDIIGPNGDDSYGFGQEFSSDYERELEKAAELIGDALPIGKTKTIGLLEVSEGVRQLIAERDEMRTALRVARANALHQHRLGLSAFAIMCGVSPTTMSRWTADPITGEPDIVCRGGTFRAYRRKRGDA